MTQHLEQRTAASRDDYQTPEWYLNLVREVFDMHIVLDPATSQDNPTQAHYRFYPPNDGLTLSWEGYPNVFVNPPYGRALLPWAQKIVKEAPVIRRPMIVLTPGRPDTRWFDLLATNCAAQADHRKRITFKGCKDPAKFPSVSWYFGPQPERFAAVFKPYCRVRVGGLV